MSTLRLIGLLVLIAGAVFAIALGALFFSMPNFKFGKSDDQQPRSSYEIMQAVRAGDYTTAEQKFQSVINDPNASEAEKAIATYNAIGVEYRLSGDPAARLADIRRMKSVITDQSIPLRARVYTLNILAGQYSFSGAEPDTFNEIFKDPPFSQYREEGENFDTTARISGRNLFLWSYDLMPTSLAAINISRWYSEQRVMNPGLATSTIREYNNAAEDYLKKAEAASEQEAKDDPEYLNSTRYLSYRHWRAVIIGRLSRGTGERAQAYQAVYRDEYDKFLNFAQQQKNALSSEYILYSRMFYAQLLSRYGETAAAKVQLDLLADAINAVTDPEVNVFLRFVRNEYTERPDGPTWTNLFKNQFQYSEKFKAAIEKVVNSKL